MHQQKERRSRIVRLLVVALTLGPAIGLSREAGTNTYTLSGTIVSGATSTRNACFTLAATVGELATDPIVVAANGSIFQLIPGFLGEPALAPRDSIFNSSFEACSS